MYIYVLLLQGNKYFVGTSDSPEEDISEHYRGNGCEWTKMYCPIEVLVLLPDTAYEDKITFEYMDKYGIDNVRSTKFNNIELTYSEIEFIQEKIYKAKNQCYNCGELGHIQNECYSLSDSSSYTSELSSDYESFYTTSSETSF